MTHDPEVERPHPATADSAADAYVFEKSVPLPHGATGRIDLYRRGCFDTNHVDQVFPVRYNRLDSAVRDAWEDKMTLKVTFDLPSEVESQIRRTLRRNNRKQARRLIIDALEPAVEGLLSQLDEPEEDAEWEAIAEELFGALDNSLDKNSAPLSDYAVSRAGIYEDHV